MTAVLLLLIISNFVVLGVFVVGQMMLSQIKLEAQQTQTYALEIAARSAFPLMEAALQRRFWEPPPDNDCMRTLETKGTLKISDDTVVQMVARFIPDDPEHLIYEFQASVTKNDKTVKAIKRYELKDAGGNLLVLKATEGSVTKESSFRLSLDSSTNPKRPTTLLGNNKNIYLEGELVLNPTNFRMPLPAPTDANTNSDDSFLARVAANDPKNYNIIVQAPQMMFTGGIKYADQLIPFPWAKPIPGKLFPVPTAPINRKLINQNAINWLKDVFVFPDSVASEGAQNQFVRVLKIGGQAVFFKDYSKAVELVQALKEGKPLEKSKFINNAYPVALTGGDTNKPIQPSSAMDTGSYLVNSERRFVLQNTGMIRGGPGPNQLYETGWNISDVTCVAGKDLNCSSSKDFPNGFGQWKYSAGLNDSLKASDTNRSELPNFPSITPDTLAALKEDAAKCGLVITASNALPKYEDCQPVKSNHVARALSSFLNFGDQTGLNDLCKTYSVLSNSNLSLKVPVTVEMLSRSKKALLSRRVIFSETPVEIRQDSKKGLFADAIPDVEVRKNLPIWFVSANIDTSSSDTYVSYSEFVLRGFQADKRQVLPTQEPEKIRMVSFNKDVSDDMEKLPSLKLAFIAPGITQFVAESYVHLSRNALITNASLVQSSFDDAGVQLVDLRKSFIHQHDRWEEDAYKYGRRDLELENVAFFVTTSDFNSLKSNESNSLGQYSKSGARCRSDSTQFAYCTDLIPVARLEDSRLFYLKGFWNIHSLQPESKNLECSFNKVQLDTAGMAKPVVKASDISLGKLTYDQLKNMIEVNHLPPRSSKFFEQKSVVDSDGNPAIEVHVAPDFLPYAFYLQYNALKNSLGTSSIKISSLFYRGILYALPVFSYGESTSGSQTKSRATRIGYNWPRTAIEEFSQVNRFYSDGANNVSCDNLSDTWGYLQSTNMGSQSFVFETPSDSFDVLGIISGTPIPGAISSTGGAP